MAKRCSLLTTSDDWRTVSYYCDTYKACPYCPMYKDSFPNTEDVYIGGGEVTQVASTQPIKTIKDGGTPNDIEFVKHTESIQSVESVNNNVEDSDNGVLDEIRRESTDISGGILAGNIDTIDPDSSS